MRIERLLAAACLAGGAAFAAEPVEATKPAPAVYVVEVQLRAADGGLLACPRLAAPAGHPATISVGGQRPFVTAIGGSGSDPRIDVVDIGARVRLTLHEGRGDFATLDHTLERPDVTEVDVRDYGAGPNARVQAVRIESPTVRWIEPVRLAGPTTLPAGRRGEPGVTVVVVRGN